MVSLVKQLEQYSPFNEQENVDLRVILHALESYPDIFDRSNLVMHMTASSWITNSTHDKILMIYHNIYNSWAWTGGHADGETDLCKVAVREAKEETGLSHVKVLLETPFSLETLTVNSHIRKGIFVPSHLHLNVTYLLEADEKGILHVKEDENNGVSWFQLNEAVFACSETWMRPIYQKLNQKLLDR